MAEDEGDKKLARALLSEARGELSLFLLRESGATRRPARKRRRLEIRRSASAGQPAASAAPPHDWETPADNIRAQKAQLLANAALYDFAVAEMQAASPGSPPWEAKSVAEIYNEQGSYIRAIETLKRAVPGYFAAEIPQIPRPVWEGLFPRPFWEELKRDATANRLDPHLVASLIRQESEFNPSAHFPGQRHGTDAVVAQRRQGNGQGDEDQAFLSRRTAGG